MSLLHIQPNTKQKLPEGSPFDSSKRSICLVESTTIRLAPVAVRQSAILLAQTSVWTEVQMPGVHEPAGLDVQTSAG